MISKPYQKVNFKPKDYFQIVLRLFLDRDMGYTKDRGWGATEGNTLMLDAAQIRAARGLLDWTRDQLAAACGVSVPALAKIETGKSTPHAETLVKVQGALEQAGIVFCDNSGVKRKSEIVTIYEGQQGLYKFYDDIYLTALRQGGEMLISGGNQQDFYDALGIEFISMHAERLRKLDNIKIKMIKPESRSEELALSYIEYRVVPEQMFFQVPFYVFGQKLAIIVWQPAPRVVVLDDMRVAEAYRQQFATIWRLAKRVDVKGHVEI